MRSFLSLAVHADGTLQLGGVRFRHSTTADAGYQVQWPEGNGEWFDGWPDMDVVVIEWMTEEASRMVAQGSRSKPSAGTEQPTTRNEGASSESLP